MEIFLQYRFRGFILRMEDAEASDKVKSRYGIFILKNINSKYIKGSIHYPVDKQKTTFRAKATKGLCSKRRNLIYHPGSELILKYLLLIIRYPHWQQLKKVKNHKACG